MVKYQPSKFWGKPKEIVLDSKFCKQYGTKAAVQEFSLSLDREVIHNYDATVIGYVASITTDTAEVDPATIIPEKFQQYCKVLGKELADKLPDHK
jgi:short-subunit dehydrogenase